MRCRPTSCARATGTRASRRSARPEAAMNGVNMTTTAIERLKDRLPGYARDLRLNLGLIEAAAALTPQQAWGTAVCAAHTSRNAEVTAAIEEAAAPHLTPAALDAARGAASIMGMNNVY